SSPPENLRLERSSVDSIPFSHDFALQLRRGVADAQAGEASAKRAAERLGEACAEAGRCREFRARAEQLAGNAQRAAEQRTIHAVKAGESLQTSELVLAGA